MIEGTADKMAVHVVHGKRPGPVLFVTAAIQGDEINGIEISRRLLVIKAFARALDDFPLEYEQPVIKRLK